MKFKRGETIYHIHAFPATGKSWINKGVVVVVGTNFKNTDSPSMVVRYSDHERDTEISLLDANIIHNTYNSHRIFKSELEANAYVNDPDNWRPLGFTAKEWADSRKDEYLAAKLFDKFMDGLYYEEF